MNSLGFKDLDDAFTYLDKIFSSGDTTIMDFAANVPRCFTPESSYPPVNIYIEPDTKNMIFEFAVAGIEEDRVSVDFKNDYMLFEIAAKKDESVIKYMIHGIRSSAIKSKYLVPASKYKHDEASAILKNGVLSVTIPSNPEAAPKKVPIKRE